MTNRSGRPPTASRDAEATLEVHSRHFYGVSRPGQVLVRSSVTYRLPRGFSASGGHLYAGRRLLGSHANDEHLGWKQLGYASLRGDAGPLVLGRTWLEQHFRSDEDDVGQRTRR